MRTHTRGSLRCPVRELGRCSNHHSSTLEAGWGHWQGLRASADRKRVYINQTGQQAKNMINLNDLYTLALLLMSMPDPPTLLHAQRENKRHHHFTLDSRRRKKQDSSDQSISFDNSSSYHEKSSDSTKKKKKSAFWFWCLYKIQQWPNARDQMAENYIQETSNNLKLEGQSRTRERTFRRTKWHTICTQQRSSQCSQRGWGW